MGKALDLLEKMENLSLLEMANASKDETGLPVVTWFMCKTGKEKHGPRIKVRDGYQDKYSADNLISVTVSDNPRFIKKPNNIKTKDQEKIINWIIKNKVAILDLWDNKITHGMFLNRIK